MTDLNEMWQELERYQPYAEKRGFGAEWLRMCRERTEKAAHVAADAAGDAARAAAWYAAWAAEAAVAAARAARDARAEWAAAAAARDAALSVTSRKIRKAIEKEQT